MILVDTSVWIDHFRGSNHRLVSLLDQRLVLTHPYVVGELAMGNLRDREIILTDIRRLPQARTAFDDEVLTFVNSHRLSGRGIGYIDAHLLVATKLSAPAALWTEDKRLARIAEDLGLAHEP